MQVVFSGVVAAKVRGEVLGNENMMLVRSTVRKAAIGIRFERMSTSSRTVRQKDSLEVSVSEGMC